MARLTVEDCLPHVENRFDLILKSAKRAREIERGSEPLVPWDNDKPTVLALREIAAGLLNVKTVAIVDASVSVDVPASPHSTEIDEFIAEEMPVIADVAIAPEAPEVASEE